MKTGTTNDAKDLNAYGYIAPPTQQGRRRGEYALTVGVWAGNSDSSAVTTVANPVFSLDVAAPVWDAFLSEVTRTWQINDFHRPDGLSTARVDAFTGYSPSEFSRDQLTELFIRGPFYVEGLLQGTLGGAVAVGGLYGAHLLLAPQAPAAWLSSALTGPFLRGEVDEVLVVYPHWINVGRQPPTLLKLLPIAPEEPGAQGGGVPPLFEPSAEAILDQLLPLYLRQTIFSVLAEQVASEQLARRMAMKLATDNAEEMVTTLTRKYNAARQALITKELAEIIGGAEALK